MKKLSKAQLADMLAKAMNILNDIHNDVNEDGSPVLKARNMGEFCALGNAMPESADFWNNGTVTAQDLL